MLPTASPEGGRRLPRETLRSIARLGRRIETTVAQLTERPGPARHGAKSLWGLPACTAAIPPHTSITPSWLPAWPLRPAAETGAAPATGGKGLAGRG